MARNAHSILFGIVQFLTGLTPMRRVSAYHDIKNGKCVILRDEEKDRIYLLQLVEVTSTKEVGKLTADRIINDGGFYETND